MSERKYTISLEKIVKRFNLERVKNADNVEDILIRTSEVNRPGMQLPGFYDYFDNERLEILGKVEYTYLSKLEPKDRAEKIDRFFSTGFPALIVTRDLELFPEIEAASDKYNIPVFRVEHNTSDFVSMLISYLNVELAPRQTFHGVLIEVYGEGVLLLGESGVGKSETAAELVKRGHRLVTDDSVEIKRVSDHSLVGSSPELTRHFLELRGIGIIDVKNLYGVGAVKDTEKINFIMHLEQWEQGKQYDRLGMDDEYTEILGIKVPSVTIPIKPGRNLAIIVEIAAMNNRQKRSGYNAAVELNNRLIAQMEAEIQQREGK